jgi:hypothetical protein
MRLAPIVELAVTVAAWTFVLRLLRDRRARLGTAAPAHAMRSYRLHTSAAICATVGVTWFTAWLVTDAIGPHWLHTLSLPASLICLGAGAVVAGYAGWIGGV